MGTNVITADRKSSAPADKKRLDLELTEAREISELLIKKLEAKIQAVQMLETAIQKKISAHESVLSAVDAKLASLGEVIRRMEAIEKLHPQEIAIQKGPAILEQAIRQTGLLDQRIHVAQGLAAEISDLKEFAGQAAALEKRIQSGEAVAASADRKTAALTALISRSEAVEKRLLAAEAVVASAESRSAALQQTIDRAEEAAKQVREGESLVARLDRKIAAIDRMIQRTELLNAANGVSNRQKEIVVLTQKGLAAKEIADVLDIPQGEVELILELGLQTL